jgi:hypothetical protein
LQVATCAAAAIAEPLLGMVDTVCIGHLGLLPLAAMVRFPPPLSTQRHRTHHPASPRQHTPLLRALLEL